ncbi:NAD(P)-dependent oxidoreductase [Nakamurella sp.]|uniref:NAD(P)-dependent oxidoreductase n=1 Tax=Nakamurella sp. TaxID=1869182 RepID=UPI003B3ACCB0
MTAPTVLVTARSFGTGRRDLAADLSADGIRVLRGPADHRTLAPLLAEVDAWIAGTGPVTDEHLAAAPRLRIVARYGVGVDAVDLVAAARRGILVTNTPGANSGAVADHAIALLLAALRGVTAGDKRVRGGSWTVGERARELGSLTVGVVGFGRIGRGVAARLRGFGCRVLATDPFVPADAVAAAGAEPVAPEAIAETCEVVTLHAPGDAVVVTQAWLAAAPPGLVLVNTARAALVDEAALAGALRAGRVAAYAADTLVAEGGFESPLLAADLADRVTVTPHTAAQTVEAVDLMGLGAVTAVRAVLAGADPDPAVTVVGRERLLT